MKNDPEARDALRLIRATIEEHCPPGVLPSQEAVNGLYGPELIHEAEALAAAIVATIDKMQLRVMMKPSAPSTK
ncbi:hypothetical protein CK228_24625 [Mesorhizobium sp. WSM4312]|uniref:hypothetical protein n=1 Tax=unclassified Mesorhizobium TaxID=325217 RepID=UPI000BAE893B|nr:MULTISPECIES: hypothetical protein [unclassified Mesorhizobium]PBB23944.1 hypothetical protein CK232_24490 [Mesorhizobium sp. WSM4304]PBB65926.1 hypothetical protein CK228_24625 [Mesorhizobium sp. WSM4312]PBB72896.1 hypothetical protein CK227_24875 [Mesorhizobium sp. WSM4308]PBC20080.1 hypothetical protein CK226_25230 [Mesorhizobium sp. WSM4311]TRC75278.1 hypothetical protein FJV80_28310 [Mesorhizobium sp. WSM4310]